MRERVSESMDECVRVFERGKRRKSESELEGERANEQETARDRRNTR